MIDLETDPDTGRIISVDDFRKPITPAPDVISNLRAITLPVCVTRKLRLDDPDLMEIVRRFTREKLTFGLIETGRSGEEWFELWRCILPGDRLIRADDERYIERDEIIDPNPPPVEQFTFLFIGGPNISFQRTQKKYNINVSI